MMRHLMKVPRRYTLSAQLSNVVLCTAMMYSLVRLTESREVPRPSSHVSYGADGASPGGFDADDGAESEFNSFEPWFVSSGIHTVHVC